MVVKILPRVSESKVPAQGEGMTGVGLVVIEWEAAEIQDPTIPKVYPDSFVESDGRRRADSVSALVEQGLVDLQGLGQQDCEVGKDVRAGVVQAQGKRSLGS